MLYHQRLLLGEKYYVGEKNMDINDWIEMVFSRVAIRMKSFRNTLNVFHICVCVSHLVVSDSVIPRTIARQAPLSISPGKNTGVGCHPLLQGDLPVPGIESGLLHSGQIYYNLSHCGVKATHSSFLTWKIPWTEEPGRPQSMGLQRVSHDWATNTFWLNIFHLCFLYTYISFPHIHIYTTVPYDKVCLNLKELL